MSWLAIPALRDADGLTTSLAAESDARIVGHIAFSPGIISDGTIDCYGLSLISVLTGHYRRGMAKSLINTGLSYLKELGGKGCALVGDPNYYQRLGFKNYPEFVHEEGPQEVFMILPFSEKIPHGTTEFHAGFSAEG